MRATLGSGLETSCGICPQARVDGHGYGIACYPILKGRTDPRLRTAFKESISLVVWIARRAISASGQGVLLFPDNSLASHSRISDTRSHLIATDVPYGSR